MTDTPHQRTLSDQELRITALSLALESHGPAAGETRDACFTGRAQHFYNWLNSTPTEDADHTPTTNELRSTPYPTTPSSSSAPDTKPKPSSNGSESSTSDSSPQPEPTQEISYETSKTPQPNSNELTQQHTKPPHHTNHRKLTPMNLDPLERINTVTTEHVTGWAAFRLDEPIAAGTAETVYLAHDAAHAALEASRGPKDPTVRDVQNAWEDGVGLYSQVWEWIASQPDRARDFIAWAEQPRVGSTIPHV